jgi:hypothetical protein
MGLRGGLALVSSPRRAHAVKLWPRGQSIFLYPPRGRASDLYAPAGARAATNFFLAGWPKIFRRKFYGFFFCGENSPKKN